MRGVDEARGYPVAPGNSVTFKDETAPYVYVKTMGFSQLDTPRFERFRLVREDDAAPDPAPQNAQPDLSAYATHADTDALKGDITALKADVAALKAKFSPIKEETI